MALATSLARAERAGRGFSSRPVRIVVAFPPGGPTDFVGRLVADKMTAALGQRVYIDNKPGANGTLGGDRRRQVRTRRLLAVPHHRRRGDGVAAHHGRTCRYDALRDFAPVALVTKVTEVLVVTPKLGIKTVKDLVALAKEKPGGISFASTGIGSPPHLAQELLDASGGRQIPARALSRRGAGADRSARRPGAGALRRHAGADRANPGRQPGADRRSRRTSATPSCRTCRRSPSRAIPTPTRRTGTRCWRRQRRRLRSSPSSTRPSTMR